MNRPNHTSWKIQVEVGFFEGASGTKLAIGRAGDEDWACKRAGCQTMEDKKKIRHFCATECEPFDDTQNKN